MRTESTPPELTASLELVARVQAGDADARERLFARYTPRVLRVVRARMGARLRELEEPEDILQNTFLAALTALERFEAREDAALIDWFARLVENQIRDTLKTHGAQKRDAGRRGRLSGGEGAAEAELETDDPGPLEHLTREEEARLLDECTSELPEHEREALVLRDLADASWTMIAERLGRPTEAAARELHRRAQLRLMERYRKRVGR